MKKLCASLLFAVSSACIGTECPMDLLISSQEISSRIKECSEQINKDYQNKNLTVVMVMKGAICVTADLIREIAVPFKLEFVRASSYGYNGTTGRDLTISGLDKLEIEGRDILIVDDIFETGNTMLGICKQVETKSPQSIKTLVLLSKNIERKTDYRPDYVLFEIPDRFVVGYGLDYKELFRGLPDICAFVDDTPPF